MNLAESSNQHRVPILLTGNDFSNTYDALLRDGRADIFEWAPLREEKLMIARSILQPFVSRYEWQQLDGFIEKYAEKNIAFFAQIKCDLRQEIVYKSLEHIGRINSNSLREISGLIRRDLAKVNVLTLQRLAEARIESRRRGGV